MNLTGFDNTADIWYPSLNLLSIDMLRYLLRNNIKQTLSVEAAKTNLNRTFPDVKLNWKWIQFAQIQVVRWLLRIEARIDTVLCNKERWPITCKSVDSFTGLMAAIWRADLRAESQGSWSCIEIYTSRPGLPATCFLFISTDIVVFCWIAIGNALVSARVHQFNITTYKTRQQCPSHLLLTPTKYLYWLQTGCQLKLYCLHHVTVPFCNQFNNR